VKVPDEPEALDDPDDEPDELDAEPDAETDGETDGEGDGDEPAAEVSSPPVPLGSTPADALAVPDPRLV
jgi:hypothetical protein